MSSALATTLSTLQRIRTKARRLTASPSQSQITDAQLDDYINTFFLFDIPELLKFINLREIYEFYTDPNIEAYDFPRNSYLNIYQPIYIAGYQSFFSESREQFFRIYPQLQYLNVQGAGDGTAGPYSFQFSNFPLLRGFDYPPGTEIFSQVFFSFTDGTGNSVIARDDGAGGFLDEAGTALTGTIDYVTGAVTGLVFGSAVPSGTTINGQSIPYQASRPQALLFFNDKLILRPVPDTTYQVSMEVLKQPTALLTDNSNPELEEWWQLLAFGCAKKILEDRQDMTSLANIMPSLKEQEILCLRRTSQQLAQERVATIYSEQLVQPYGNFINRF